MPEVVRARVVELAERGFTQSDVAAQVLREVADPASPLHRKVRSMSQGSVSKIIRDARDAGQVVLARTKSAGARADLPTTEPGAVFLVPTAIESDAPALEQLRARAEDCRQAGDKALSQGRMSDFRDMVRAQKELLREIAKLEPPPEVDPEADPLSLQARKLLRGKIEDIAAEFGVA